ncbi:conserved hypothetical protein [Paraburkholderia piptadeniae]|uniref:Uncharacterized protein n=1 Tax=Paraburkholderia piptadeniae TaxID=1701573 RepID=A0A1N7S8S9_9BURK|nr:conserved hypothetical protein [Paraburkholderia piptadeniae]
MSIDVYAMVENGSVVMLITWDGNSDVSTGGWAPPVDATMVKLPRYPQAGDVATKDSSGNWSFAAPS